MYNKIDFKHLIIEKVNVRYKIETEETIMFLLIWCCWFGEYYFNMKVANSMIIYQDLNHIQKYKVGQLKRIAQISETHPISMHDLGIRKLNSLHKSWRVLIMLMWFFKMEYGMTKNKCGAKK